MEKIRIPTGSQDFLYLVAILDVASRKVLSLRPLNTLTPDFFVEAPKEALAKFGKPEIFNAAQGSQITGEEWIRIKDRKSGAEMRDDVTFKEAVLGTGIRRPYRRRSRARPRAISHPE